MLSLTHNLRSYDRDVRKGDWQAAENFCLLTHPIEELSSLTLGIVGFGVLGQGVARIADAFNMNVLISSRPGSTAVAEGRVEFRQLLEQADIVSLHCPLNEHTHKLFGASEFAVMKSTAVLINSARGGLVDSNALVAALRDGQIAAAAIDVLPQEPPTQGNPLLDYSGDNLIITPHIAWGTRQARQAAVDDLVANLVSFLEGGRRNRVV